MFVTKKALPRRTFLQAMGATIALPMLDAMVPALFAQRGKPTPRFGFVYIANGVIQKNWIPATTGAAFYLPATLQPWLLLSLPARPRPLKLQRAAFPPAIGRGT